MFVISRNQMAVFEQNTAKMFKDRTYAHLLEYFPRHCEFLGEAQMRFVIHHGWQKAKSYDLTAECCVRSYIELMCVLGSGFDSDSLMPWAGEILRDKSDSDQVSRSERLYDKAWDYVDHAELDYRDATGQPTTNRFEDELRQFRQERTDTTLTAAIRPQFIESLQSCLKRLFPAKCAYVGDETLALAVSLSIEAAILYKITTTWGVGLFAIMRFVLGGDFNQDPLFPCISSALNDQAILDQDKRVERLYMEGLALLKQWWGLVPGQER